MGIGASKDVDLKVTFAELMSSDMTAEQLLEWQKALSVKRLYNQHDCLDCADIRQFRNSKPQQFARLCLHLSATFCSSVKNIEGENENKIRALNYSQLLVRIVPFVFEELEWRSLFWVSLPPPDSGQATKQKESTMAEELLHCLCIALFTPGFTVGKNKESTETDEFGHIWEAGIGPVVSPYFDEIICQNRIDLLRLLLTLCSEGLYLPRTVDAHSPRNRWIEFVTSRKNPRLLCLFTSLFNTVLSYRQAKTRAFYQNLNMNKHTLAEICAQLLCVLSEQPNMSFTSVEQKVENIFDAYLSRIHLDEDYFFILNGFSTLMDLSIPVSSIIAYSSVIDFHQEILLLLWKMINVNPDFLAYILKNNNSLDVLFAILYHLDNAKCDTAEGCQFNLCILMLLQLSAERNFAVRLNRPVPSKMTIPGISLTTGCFADLLFMVLHGTMSSAVTMENMDFLLESILSIMVNVSPYIKSIKPLTAEKLVHFVEVFSTPWFIFKEEHNYRFVHYALIIIENLIQHQFDGNTALAYILVRKRTVFTDLANLKYNQASSYGHKALPEKTMPKHGSIESVLVNVPIQTTTLDGKLVESEPWEFEYSSDWKPTEEWFNRWHSNLPLGSIIRMLDILVPQINKICLDDSITNCDYIINFLKSGTLVGLLPPAPPIVARRIRWNHCAISLWSLLYTWQCIAYRESSAQSFIWKDSKVTFLYNSTRNTN